MFLRPANAKGMLLRVLHSILGEAKIFALKRPKRTMLGSPLANVQKEQPTPDEQDAKSNL